MSPKKRRPAPPRRPQAPMRPVSRRPTSGTKWLFPTVLVVIVVAIGVAIALSAGGKDGDSGGGKDSLEIATEVNVDGTALAPLADSGADAAVGTQAPTLSGPSFDGTNVVVAPEGGRPLVVVFLAHFCPHCQAEVPRLVELASEGGAVGVDVVTGTNPGAPNYPPSKWLRRERWPFPVLVDTAEQTAAEAFGLPAYPFMVFLDADGTVLGRVSGEIGIQGLRSIFGALAAGEELSLPGSPGGSTSQ